VGTRLRATSKNWRITCENALPACLFCRSLGMRRRWTAYGVSTLSPGGVACRWSPARREVPGSEADSEVEAVAGSDDRRGIAGISSGGIIAIVGIVLMLFWSFWIGLIIVLVGLIAFGGFARGKWY
jgi:hypothetical protein